MTGLTRKRLTMAGAAAALVAILLGITSAFGGPGFLTTKKANKRFATKAEVATKADAASVYSKGGADEKFLPLGHSIRQMVSPDNWVTDTGSPPTFVFHNGATASLHREGSGNATFSAALDAPQTIQGRTVRIDSFELCYSATHPEATMSRVFLVKVSGATAANIMGTTSAPIDDSTAREDQTCRTYSGASSVAIGADDFVEILINVTYTDTGNITVTRLSLNLST